jgi:hypothetical protein
MHQSINKNSAAYECSKYVKDFFCSTESYSRVKVAMFYCRGVSVPLP